ncbi:MAG: AbrB/MazE/SpoVT family DNA-binding domain-containing protein [Actinomycetota bacterium]
MASTIVRAKGQVTIPTEIRRAAGLEEGDPVEVEMTADGILLRPKKLIDAAQAWFWSASWQEGEREATRDLAAGRTARYENAEKFLASLGGAPARKAKPKRASPRAGLGTKK